MSERTKATTKAPESKSNNRSHKIQQSALPHSHSLNSPVDHIMFLQRTVGNQAVQGLFQSGLIQAKLKIGQPGDIYEQEADRVADEVMRIPVPEVQMKSG